MDLTLEQVRPVESDIKLNVCLAVPGSGKTTVVVHRALRLAPQAKRILICTFSRKAAGEIEKRLGTHSNIDVFTLHAFGYSIIRKHWQLLGELLGADPQSWPPSPLVMTEKTELDLIREVFGKKDAQIRYKEFERLRQFELDPERIVALNKAKGISFGPYGSAYLEDWARYERSRTLHGYIGFGDMITCAVLLLSVPYIGADWFQVYDHVIIDEAQDTCEGQWELLRNFIEFSVTTFAVGDRNQSIYGWRNASGRLLNYLLERHGSVTFSLSQSFRSQSNVVTLANQIVPDGVSYINSMKRGGHLKVRSFNTRHEEVSFVLAHSTPDTAVLARTNSYLEPFERECIEQDIPYRGSGFYSSKHIRRLADALGNTSGSHTAVLGLFSTSEDFSSEQKEDFRTAGTLIQMLGAEKFLDLVERSKFGREGVTLSTGHGAKGLEWDRVFVVGAASGLVPHRKAIDVREEQNLFYVMVTRAKSELMISYTGMPSPFIPKEFLEKFPI